MVHNRRERIRIVSEVGGGTMRIGWLLDDLIDAPGPLTRARNPAVPTFGADILPARSRDEDNAKQ
jgi:hypothetical protein